MKQQTVREVINLTKVTKLEEEKPGLCFSTSFILGLRDFIIL